MADTRIQVELGILKITEAVSENDAAERKLLFLPGALPAGIEPQDPMISARQEAYPVSYRRRRGPKEAAA